jgi:hypothetical protein
MLPRPATALTARRPRIRRADDASGRGPVGLRQCGVEFSRCLAAGAWHTSMPTKNSTKFGKIVTEICRFSGRRTRAGGRSFFSRGDFFVGFFLGDQAIIFINYRRDDSAVPILTTMRGSADQY